MYIEKINKVNVWVGDPTNLPLVISGRFACAIVIGTPRPGEFTSAVIQYPEKTYTVDEHAIFFHKEGDVYTSTINGTVTKCLVINFHGVNMPEHFVVNGCEDLREKMKEIYRIWNCHRPDEYYHLQCIALTTQLLAELLRRRDKSALPFKHRKLLMTAFDFIHSNYSDAGLRISDVAAAACISERYLDRIFYETYRISPKHYLTQHRLNRAKELLMQGSDLGEDNALSIEEISRRCGFSEANYFTNVFKKYTGFSPSEYRRTQIYKSE